MHTHFIPYELVEVLEGGSGPASLAVERRGERPFIVHPNGLRYPVLPEFHDAATKLRLMDEDGIDAAVLSITPTLFAWDMPDEATQLARLINDAAAAMVAAGDGRLHAMASVPMNVPERAAEELRRAREDLGLVGVLIGTSVGEIMLDDRSLDPFWAAAAQLAMPVMLHPYISMVSAPYPGLGSHHLSNVVGNPYETALAASRLIVGGTLDRHPELTVGLAHGGGYVPYTLGRLDHAFGTDGSMTTRSWTRSSGHASSRRPWRRSSCGLRRFASGCGAMGEPRTVRWTDHALAKAELLAIARADVEQVVLDDHHARRANTGAADWLVRSGLLVVAYNHPDQDDDLAALIVTLWRRA